MTDLSPEAKELLRQARSAFSPRGDRLQAVRSALDAQIGAHGMASATWSPPSGVVARAMRTAGWGALGHPIAAAVVIGALAAGGVLAFLAVDRSNPGANAPLELAPQEQQSAQAAPSPIEENAPPPNAPPAWIPTPTWQALPADLPPKGSPAVRDRTRGNARARPRGETREAPLDPPPNLPAPPPPAPVQATDSLAEEVSMLRDARIALDRGEAAQALRLLDAHEKRFQRGTLYEERLATRVQALCALRFIDGARSTAQELERVAPRSPHLARVRASCIAQPSSK